MKPIQSVSHSKPRDHNEEEKERNRKLEELLQKRREQEAVRKLEIIEATKAQIEALSASQDFIYDKMLKEVGVEPSDWIHDYVFNDYKAALPRIKEML